MDTIRCPSCHRLLTFTGAALIQSARCPGCRTVFNPFGGPEVFTVGIGEPDSTGAVDDNDPASNAGDQEEFGRRSGNAVTVPMPKSKTTRFDRGEKASWTGFALGFIFALVFERESQPLLSRIIAAPVCGMLCGLLANLVYLIFSQATRSVKLLVVAMYFMGSCATLLVFLISVSKGFPARVPEWSAERGVVVTVVSLAGGAIFLLATCFVIHFIKQVSKVPTLMAFAAEPDNPEKKIMPGAIVNAQGPKTAIKEQTRQEAPVDKTIHIKE